MKKSAFTMIELIFVIVILGILATVAIPKLASLEDDAIVAKEKSGIASARSGVLTIQSRSKNRAGKAFTLNIEKFATDNTNGESVAVAFTGRDDLVTGTSTTSNYPVALSVSNFTGDASTVPAVAGAINTGLGMALVLGADERDQWQTKGDVNKSFVAGPASSTIATTDAEFNTLGSWEYTITTGRFTYGNTTF